MPVKDSGVRYITSADIDFTLDALIIESGNKHRITAQDDIRPIEETNARRRGSTRKVKVIDTT